MCCKNDSSVINLIYSGQQLLSYIKINVRLRRPLVSVCTPHTIAPKTVNQKQPVDVTLTRIHYLRMVKIS